MKRFKCLLVSSILLFQTSLCYAQDSINITVAPDPTTHCHQYGVEVAITQNSTLGVLSAYKCTDRPTFGAIIDQVTNKFNRILIPWKYSPHGVFKTGYFVDAMVGVERSEFRTTAGSSANVSYIDTAAHLGYQWFWRNGLNVSAIVGVGHLMPASLDKSISPAESSTVIDYLDEQTSTTTHVGAGVYFGWVF